jgi:MFS family permease
VIEPTTLRHRFLVLLTLRWFQTGLQLPVLILLLRARGLDLTSVGVVVAVYSLTTAALELPTGGLADVIGRRRVLTAASVAFVAESLTFGLGQDLAVLALAAGLGGLARALDSGPLEAWFVDSMHSAAPDADLRRDLARAKAIEAGALGLGALAGGGLVAIVPMETQDSTVLDLSIPFLVSAGICVVMVGAIARWVREPHGDRRPTLVGVVRDVPTTIRRGLGLAARSGPLRRTTILMAGMGIALATVELLAPASIDRIVGGEDEAAGPYAVLLTLGFFGSAIGSAQASKTAHRLGSSSRGILVARVLGAGALMGVAASSLGAVAVALVSFYALNGVARPLMSDIIHRSVTSAERATILSVQSLTLQLSAVLASLAIGPVAQHVSIEAAFAIGASVLALGAFACVNMPGEASR